MERYLITTADERTWKFDRPVLFLGEWCRIFDRKHVWSSMDAAVAEPFGLGPGEKLRNFERVKRSASMLLDDLIAPLNAFHGTARSRREWEIILGHWVIRYSSLLFNRYHTIEKVLDRHELNGAAIRVGGYENLARPDSLSFIWACEDDEWNHRIYSMILLELGQQRLEPLMEDFSPLRRAPADLEEPGRSTLRRVLGKAMATAARRNDAFIVTPYLPSGKRLALELSLGQAPQLWDPVPAPVVPVDESARRRFKIDFSRYTGFEQSLRAHVSDLIPTCFLEGYSDLVRRADAVPWPTSPRFIYTANSFDTDEVFKVWTAGLVAQGVPYIAGQHGNNYGTHVWSGADFWPERSATDAFVTWGWKDNRNRTMPAFIFKTAGMPSRRESPKGRLLLIGVCLPHRLDPHDSYAEYEVYQEQQFRFVETLSDNVRAELTVRLHGEHRQHPWRDEQRWYERSPDTRLELGTAPIKTLINDSRIVVHSYDSTGILETLTLNVPTLAFWQGGFEHLIPSAREYYDALRRAGIVHETPESAAAAASAFWEDVDGWWQRTNVQQARVRFCQRYARTVKRPVRTLTKLLMTQAATLTKPPR
ncbi:MAG: transferase [Gemmatimonadaceae bacterium]|nr:transferase [Gemmatimonadaceae bacterium]